MWQLHIHGDFEQHGIGLLNNESFRLAILFLFFYRDVKN